MPKKAKILKAQKSFEENINKGIHCLDSGTKLPTWSPLWNIPLHNQTYSILILRRVFICQSTLNLCETHKTKPTKKSYDQESGIILPGLSAPYAWT